MQVRLLYSLTNKGINRIMVWQIKVLCIRHVTEVCLCMAMLATCQTHLTQMAT